MCFPPLVIGAALMGAGGLAKYFGDKKAQAAQSRVQAETRARQAALTAQQQAAFEDSLAKSGEVVDPAAIEAAKANRENALVAAMLPKGSEASFLPGQSRAPEIVRQQEATAVNQSGTQARALASALAALGGTGDQMQQLNIGIGRNSSRIGQLATDKGQEADVAAAELEAAKQKGSFLRGIGGLAMQIGAMAATGGFGGGTAAGGTVGSGAASSGLGKLGTVFVPAVKRAAFPIGPY